MNTTELRKGARDLPKCLCIDCSFFSVNDGCTVNPEKGDEYEELTDKVDAISRKLDLIFDVLL